jgi:hypothetical protein
VQQEFDKTLLRHYFHAHLTLSAKSTQQYHFATGEFGAMSEYSEWPGVRENIGGRDYALR